jgi:hypothetical protein
MKLLTYIRPGISTIDFDKSYRRVKRQIKILKIFDEKHVYQKKSEKE